MSLHWAAGSARLFQSTERELTPFWSRTSLPLRATIRDSEHIQPTLGAHRALPSTGGAPTRCPALREASHFHKVQPNSSSSSDSSCGSKSNHSLSPSVHLIPLSSFSWHARFGRGARSASLPSVLLLLYRGSSLQRLSTALHKLVSAFPPISCRILSTHLQIAFLFMWRTLNWGIFGAAAISSRYAAVKVSDSFSKNKNHLNSLKMYILPIPVKM